MELFKKFDKTVFYKKYSELEDQVKALKKLHSEIPSNEKIKQKLKISELGLKGEKEIEFELANSNIGMYVLHDINLKYENLAAQIDYIIITPGYIYFIECKNLIGNITVNNRGEFIREYNYNGKKVKEGIYSPIRQSERHIEIFKKLWNKKHTKIMDKLKSRNLDNWIKPLAVMTNSKNILNVKYAPKDIKEKIIKSDSLVNYIKKDISSCDKDLISNEKTMKENAFNIMNDYNIIIERNYEEELREWLKNTNLNKSLNKIVNETTNNDVKEKLMEYRKITSKAKNVPAYYIFNNNELEKIIQANPKNISQLKNSKILSEVKLKIYGKDIINIINE